MVGDNVITLLFRHRRRDDDDDSVNVAVYPYARGVWEHRFFEEFPSIILHAEIFFLFFVRGNIREFLHHPVNFLLKVQHPLGERERELAHFL